MIPVLTCVSSKSLDSCNRGRGIRDIALNSSVFKDVWEKSSEKANESCVFCLLWFLLASASCRT